MANKQYDVIIVGGSYSGLSAAMALGRALRQVLIIDSKEPCNSQTPHSHNFLTQDGSTPKVIATVARQQVEQYNTIEFFNGIASRATKTDKGFEIRVSTGETFAARKLIFASGIKDRFPPIEGIAECWGISVLHCPYCHGYEVRNEVTGILANGEIAFEFARLLSNWTNELTLFTNGDSELTTEQTAKLNSHGIRINENEIDKLEHEMGVIRNIVFKDGAKSPTKVLYARLPFDQNCAIPEILGCELTEDGYIQTGSFQETTVAGILACGDNASRLRTLSNAVATGTTAAMMANRMLLEEDF
ncbi:NAD(P)/FAD-dependent oxidoreductase [Flavihumibacter solisilvae]|uniref:Pyridine nucleotide-disulfide oxidoreductase n=1 Tax=Flavihumibacter solisilvae TaxID=1349421 RepID=A0A0C1IPS7_9BACT|nr:NAD(P)/FAD-dependent oxidoreductase [Flavihumibacter solisilvae]KIC96240.1 pyridine nucleotide-disulfide oxidoreductase [Flavihumibacter solisilvae]